MEVFSLPGASDAYQQAPVKQPTGSSVMGKDEFLKLLVTQLKNQDPLNPMDGQQFAAQLAQFSSVEQLMNISSKLAENGEMSGVLSQSVNAGVAAGLLGKTIEAGGNTVGWDGSREVNLGFELSGKAQKVSITIRDANGNTVRKMELNARDTGKQAIQWNGEDDHGSIVSSGKYTFEVKATDGKGQELQTRTFMQGNVDRVTFGQDGILLWLGEVSVPMGSVRSVQGN